MTQIKILNWAQLAFNASTIIVVSQWNAGDDAWKATASLLAILATGVLIAVLAVAADDVRTFGASTFMQLVACSLLQWMVAALAIAAAVAGTSLTAGASAALLVACLLLTVAPQLLLSQESNASSAHRLT